MFRTLTLKNLPGSDATVELRPAGPDGKLAPPGPVTIYGRSATGKSMVLVALSALLTGDTLPAPRSADVTAEVTGTTGAGVIITATRSAKGSRWAIAGKGEEPTRYDTAAAYRAALVARFPFLVDVELVRLLVRSDRIGVLADATGGRGLRDLIARLQTETLRARMLAAATAKGAAFAPDELVAMGSRGKRIEPTDPDWHPRLVAGLESRQTALNRAARDAELAATAAAAALAATEGRQVEVPADESALNAARTTLATAKAWRGYREDKSRREADAARVNEQRAARDAWRARKAAIGSAPVLDTVALMAAEKTISETAALVKRLEREEQDAAVLAAREAASAATSAATSANVDPYAGPESTPAGFTLHVPSYNAAIDDAIGVVQHAREGGETDHRSIKNWIDGLRKPVGERAA